MSDDLKTHFFTFTFISLVLFYHGIPTKIDRTVALNRSQHLIHHHHLAVAVAVAAVAIVIYVVVVAVYGKIKKKKKNFIQ